MLRERNRSSVKSALRLCRIFISALLLILSLQVKAQFPVRQDILLNNNWRTIANDHNQNAYNGFERPGFKTTGWQLVNVPHNWDTYEGYRRLKHGNRHGYAWYRTGFKIAKKLNKRYFLYFEGVGSFATVWFNGKKVGYHAGGRTTFTLDVTNTIIAGKPNILAVRADHPAFITTLPWVCGGCSDEVGFSEGSQPMGIFRPVHLIVTNPVRIQPFGVHIWNDTTVTERSALLHLETEVKNYGSKSQTVTVINKLLDKQNQQVAEVSKSINLPAGAMQIVAQTISFNKVKLWSLQDPYLYHLETNIQSNGQNIDREITPYGVRWISWPIGRSGNNKQFLLNGKPEFINGIAEYEHNMGQSHAFSDEQIHTVVKQVQAAGFNAFRDAHQPHNLRFQQYWDELGILWWPQFTAHIWYDTPAFRNNFKTLLVDWVKERRNSPSLILWGLQNESKLPTDFAKECSDIIRKLDPTASSQRKITTCNGGTGTDWDVPQNWTGTYGGDPLKYTDDLQKQILVGEYGAWRTIDLHTEGPFVANGPLSENRMTQLMEMKIHQAESVKDKTAGHFFWLLNSHENPGRVQAGEGLRELDRIGPVNYKGLFTAWGEPTDAFYLYRAAYAPKDKEPMVYIVSHTWPDRWLSPGKKDSICVYSNCDEVELFNDMEGTSLGRRKHQGIGTHFQWDKVDIKYNLLKAVGYVNGKKVAEDMIVLNHLPPAPHFNSLKTTGNLLQPTAGFNYIYRVNCGGPAYTDQLGHTWNADRHLSSPKTWGSTSWTDNFKEMPAMFGSQRRTFDAIAGTADWSLFQTFRYGRNQLQYHFPVANGNYRVELYFTEPWYGIGGMNCKGWRLFDVAVNGKTFIHNLDIWNEAGADKALKKVLNVKVTNGQLNIGFPNVASGQAVISAIAIALVDQRIKGTPASATLMQNLVVNGAPASRQWQLNTWMDSGDKLYTDAPFTIAQLPANLYGAEWLSPPEIISPNTGVTASFRVSIDADVYIGLPNSIKQQPAWMQGYDNTKTTIQTDENGGRLYTVYHKNYATGTTVKLGNPTDANATYIIAALPVNKMERATDLKPTTSYKPEKAVLTNEVVVTEAAGKKCLLFKTAAGGSISWDISTGVADIYTLRLKYLNTTGKALNAQVKVLAADGAIMKQELLTFSTTSADKYKTLETTTGTSINAGNYKVVITAKDATGLNISGLEVQ